MRMVPDTRAQFVGRVVVATVVSLGVTQEPLAVVGTWFGIVVAWPLWNWMKEK